MDAPTARHTLDNPLAPTSVSKRREPTHRSARFYEESLELGRELLERPKQGGGEARVRVQHAKGRMTVWERIRVLTDREPNILWQNWGPGLDGASIVTGILKIGGRDVAVYGHDFTLRAGSMDATNGAKLARLIYLAAERGIPLIGMNDSAGAFVPAGVGGLDGYSEAFAALRRISGLVPSIGLMFGYNAGGGSYLPRQGSFMIQCNDTFIGLTGPGVREERARRGRQRRRSRRAARARHERRLRPHHARRARLAAHRAAPARPTCRTTTASSRRSARPRTRSTASRWRRTSSSATPSTRRRA